MPLNIEIEVQGCESSDINVTNQCETLTLEIFDAPVSSGVQIDDAAGLGDTGVTWSADKSSRELADKVDKVSGMGLSELSFTTADKNSLDQSEQDRHTHANKSVIDDLSDNAGALEYRGLPVSDQAALDSKVDKVAGKQLSDENYTLAEKEKLGGVAVEATKNRDDSENADKDHTHVIGDVDGLDAALLTKFDKTDVVQATGQSTEKVMSQKAVTDGFDYLQRAIAGFVPFIGSYGLAHNGVADTYERTGAANFTAIQSMFRRCLLLPDGTVDYFLDPENSNYKAYGTPANITGANGYLGNVMVQIPKYYRKITVDGDVATREVSLLPEEGFTLHPAFIKAGEEVDFRYYRAYQGVEIDGKLRSVSGAVPTRSKNIVQFRGLAKANGSDWHQIDWYVLDAVRELSSIEIGTYRSQDVLGQGNSAGAVYGLSGASNEIGNGSSTSATSEWMSYRGIENFYASVWEFIDGINIRDYEPFVNGDHRTFASNVFTGDYVTTGVTQPAVNGYISAMAHTDKGFFVSAASGSSTTFFADYYAQATGNRIWRHGGRSSSAAACGSFYSGADASSSDTHTGCGAGLAF